MSWRIWNLKGKLVDKTLDDVVIGPNGYLQHQMNLRMCPCVAVLWHLKSPVTLITLTLRIILTGTQKRRSALEIGGFRAYKSETISPRYITCSIPTRTNIFGGLGRQSLNTYKTFTKFGFVVEYKNTMGYDFAYIISSYVIYLHIFFSLKVSNLITYKVMNFRVFDAFA